MARMQWRGLDGRLVFDFIVNREPADGVPSLVDISCKPSPQAPQQVMITSRPATFKARFPSGCHAHGWLRQQTPVHVDGVVNTAIFADIRYGAGPDDQQHFEGIMVACPTRGAPPPPAPWPPAPPPTVDPECPPEPVEPLPIVGSSADELFPYVYVRQWPKVGAQDLLWGFIQYTGSSPPCSSFFADLVLARNVGRAEAQALALRFIDGDRPYQGDFIGNLPMPGGPVAGFAALAEVLLRADADPAHWCAQAQEQLRELLARCGEDWSYWSSGAYAQALDRVWQSYFALVITLGYDPALLAELVRTLMLAHAIEVAVLPLGVGHGAAGAPGLTGQQLAALANATVVLPAQVFPLPPEAQPQTSPPTGPSGWIEPYAIGELQMVRQRLLRYQAGEIARIENVMRGERREIANKRTHRQLDEHKQTTAEMQVLRSDAADERSSLQEQARQAVAEATVTNQYANFTTSYGPPTQATLDGSWSQTLQPGATRGVDDAVRFARDILNRTVNRISRSVSLTRAGSTMNQTEDSVTSVVENTAGGTSLRAVFRWLNKVYEACVVNYGQRLMIEFMVTRPAAGFIAQERALSGQDYVRPVPPSLLGISTFEDVQPWNYARLGALYGVTELQAPPADSRFACATLRSGEEKLIAIPEGYRAARAFVAGTGTPVPAVLVGRQAFGSGTAASAQMNGEDGCIPVSVADSGPAGSPPADVQALVNVEIACVPSQGAMDEWRIRIYASLMRAYEQQLAVYRGRSGSGSLAQPRSPLANRQIEQRELKDACLRLLLERMAHMTGEGRAGPNASPPSVFSVNEPRYLQFFDQVLEWNEMAYTFYASPGARAVGGEHGIGTPAAGDDALFASFLQADQARVLLPVQPRHMMGFLYFFSSGMLWIGSDRLAPADPGDVALVNDLKHAALVRPPRRAVGPCWEVIVPTSMQVLDESSAALGPRAILPATLRPADGESA